VELAVSVQGSAVIGLGGNTGVRLLPKSGKRGVRRSRYMQKNGAKKPSPHKEKFSAGVFP